MDLARSMRHVRPRPALPPSPGAPPAPTWARDHVAGRELSAGPCRPGPGAPPARVAPPLRWIARTRHLNRAIPMHDAVRKQPSAARISRGDGLNRGLETVRAVRG